MDERRKFKRFDQSHFLRYKTDLFSVRVDSVTKNVCLKGSCFFSDKKLRIGKIISLTIFYRSSIPSRRIKAKVVYSVPVSDEFGKGYFNGVEFLNYIMPPL